jgi:hypothetical protein
MCAHVRRCRSSGRSPSSPRVRTAARTPGRRDSILQNERLDTQTVITGALLPAALELLIWCCKVVRFGGKGRISRRASLLAQSAHGQLQIQSIVAPPPPSRPRPRSSRIIPSTSTKNHSKHISTNRHNGELEPPRAAAGCEGDL